MLVGLLEKIGHRLLFFSLPQQLSHAGCGNKTSLATGKGALNGDESTASDGARHAAEGRTHVARSAALKHIEFWKKQKFFPPTTTSTFELSDSIVVLCRGLTQTWGRA